MTSLYFNSIELKLGAVLALFHIGWCFFNEFNNGLNAKSYPPYQKFHFTLRDNISPECYLKVQGLKFEKDLTVLSSLKRTNT